MTERSSKYNYKSFLTDEAVFKEVVPFTDRTIVPLVHQVYYIQYVKVSGGLVSPPHLSAAGGVFVLFLSVPVQEL